MLTNGSILGPDGQLRPLPADQGNVVGQDPLFVSPFRLQLTVTGSRLDPQRAAVTITGQDPPVGLTGNYHVTPMSPGIDRGAAYATFPALPDATTITAPFVDYDGQFRPQPRSSRLATPWDVGADEVPATAAASTDPRRGSP
jgi:hypothetical protein